MHHHEHTGSPRHHTTKMASDSYQVSVRDLWAVSHDSLSFNRIDADFLQRACPSDLQELPTVLEPSLTSLSAEERDSYATVIDEILEEYGQEVISGESVLELLRERNGFAQKRQRHLLKMLVIQRLKLQPTSQTVILTQTGGDAGNASMAAAVFDVPELLESILTHVTMADLIAVRRVNKALFRLIEISPTLQRKLFLVPSNNPKACSGLVYNGSPIQPFVPRDSPLWETLWGSSNIVAGMNPFLEKDLWDCVPSPDGKSSMMLLASARIKPQILNSKAWPEMYLTSPPCLGVLVGFQYTEEFESLHVIRFLISRFVYDPAGVTFATVWKALHKEGDVIVCGDYKPVRKASYDFQRVTGTTVCEQIELHRRKGIEVSLNRERSTVDSYSVAVLATEKVGGGFAPDDDGDWKRVQDVVW